MIRVALFAVLALLAAGCGDGANRIDTGDEAAVSVRRIIEDRAAEQNSTVTVSNVTCVDQGSAFQCVVEATSPETGPLTVGGSLSCDGDNCVWKPDA